MGVGGKTYIEKQYSVHKGGQRVTRINSIRLYSHRGLVVYD